MNMEFLVPLLVLSGLLGLVIAFFYSIIKESTEKDTQKISIIIGRLSSQDEN